MRLSLLAGVLFVFALASSAHADIMTFTLSFTGNAQSNLTSGEQQLFQEGIDFWDDVIIGHRDGVARSWNLNVDTISQAASGGGVLLGSAGPSGVIQSNVVAGSHTSNNRFFISTGGSSRFNTHPDAGTLTLDTIKHEIGHALGVGTLWENNEVYNDGISGNSSRTLAGGVAGEFMGANGLAAFQAEFVGQGSAAFIPVELGGGGGTAHGHWNESDDFGQTATGIVDFMGRDMRNELMTGFAAPGDDFFSNMTRQSLVDIGFDVTAAVPEPGSTAILILVSLGGIAIRRRRSNAI
jgi:hypothetical protein